MAEYVPGPATEYGKELAKWNVKRPYSEYPKMMFRARRLPSGKWSCGEVLDSTFGGAPGSAEQWSNGCQLVVQSDSDRDRAMGDGWRDDPKAALEHQEALERAIADAAAHRAYEDRNMGEKARAEAKAADDASFEHVAAVPETRRGPGRPRKEA
jgi:hypothetical protein